MIPEKSKIQKRVLEAFAAHYRRQCPFLEDQAHEAVLTLEVAPLVDTAMESHAAGIRFVDDHEGLAMLRLLGRRAARLGITPSAALSIVPGLVAALEFGLSGARETGQADPPGDLAAWMEDLAADLGPLQSTCMEGYVGGREELLDEAWSNRIESAQPIIRLGPRCLLVVLTGRLHAQALARIGDRVSKQLFREDAKSVLVDLRSLEEPQRESAVEVFSIDETARMLGSEAYFVGAGPWLEILRGSRFSVDLVRTVDSLEEGLSAVHRAAGLEVRAVPALRGWLMKQAGRFGQ